MSNSDKLEKVHEEALKQFDIAYDASWSIREGAVKARRFCDVPGAQWEDWLGDQFQNRPRPEINKIARSVDRIYNEYRNNRISVDFRPKTDAADDEVASLLDDMYRADEQDSGAQEAYDNAFQEGVKGGFGGWRLATDYEDHEDEDNERQCIQIIPITEADTSLYFDADATRYDKADARRAWLIKGMTRAAYDEKWPKHPVSDFQKMTPASFDWVVPDFVYVAEYYVREDYKETLYTYTGLAGEDDIKRYRESEIDSDEQEKLSATGYTLTKTRKIERKRVHKYIINGTEVIEDCGIIAGEHIPLIPYYGNRSIIDGIERAWGQVQRGKDAQQLYNMQVGVIAETAALGTVQKPIFHPEQIAGHEHTWAYDNITRNPYLLINMIQGPNGEPVPGGPVAMTPVPQLSQAVTALLQISNQDIQDVTGNQDQAQQVNPNVSAQAIELVQNRLDMGVFGYMDNMAKSMRRCGEVWLSIRRSIETERRKVRTLKIDGSQGTDEIMVPAIDKQTGATTTKNDISAGKYDVAVDVGPSFTTRRDATIRNVLELIGKTPDQQMQGILTQVALTQMDGEGLDDIRKFVRKQLVGQGVVPPTEEEKQQQADAEKNAQPDPNSTFLLAEAGKSQALAQKALSDSELSKAKVAEIMAGIDATKLDSLLKTINAFNSSQQPAQDQVLGQEVPQDQSQLAAPEQSVAPQQ